MDFQDAAKAALAKNAAETQALPLEEEDEGVDALEDISVSLQNIAFFLGKIDRHLFAANYLKMAEIKEQSFDDGVYQAIYDLSIAPEDLYPHLKAEKEKAEKAALADAEPKA